MHLEHQVHWFGPQLVACVDFAVSMVAGDEVDAALEEEAVGKNAKRRAWVAAREEYHTEHWLAFESAFCAMYKRMALADKNTPQYADDGAAVQVDRDVLAGVLFIRLCKWNVRSI